ncbi:MAG: M15 family metallopeptidase [Chthoniobacterales bacterium]
MTKSLSRGVITIVLFFGRCVALFATDRRELVSISKVDPSIVIGLRYATAQNVTGHPLYPSNMPALVRPHVAAQLKRAQEILSVRGYRLKIWDAYRPRSAQEQLWALARNTDYVADPKGGDSLHTCGVAVDATIVDSNGREVKMPTDFDAFTSSAMLRYQGNDPAVRRNLRLLQHAMARAGFYGMRTEWWHFVSKDWKGYVAIPEVTVVTPAHGPSLPRSDNSANRTPSAVR